MDVQDRNDAQELNLLELVQVLVRRKMLIVKICAFAAVASAGYSMLMPNIYTATAKVLPPQKEAAGGLSAVLGQVGSMVGMAGGAGMSGGGGELYLGILKSRSVADAVIRRPELAKGFAGKNPDAARFALSSALTLQAGKDGIISIAAEDEDPKRAALVANALVDELGKTTVRLNLSKASTERVFLEKRLELVKHDLKAAEENLKTFSQGNKVVQVDAQARASIEGIARMKAELATKEVQLAVLRSNQTEQSAEVMALSTGIKRLRSELGTLSGSAAGGEGIPSVGRMPGVGLEFARRLREVKVQEAIFEQLSKQYELAKLNEAKDSSSFQVLDEAVPPLHRTRPKRTVIVLLTTLAAFFISIFAVFIREYFSRISEDDRKILESIKKEAFLLK